MPSNSRCCSAFGTNRPFTIATISKRSPAVIPTFRFWPTLSRADSSWTGRSGHVQSHLLRSSRRTPDLDIYICGLKAMVDDVRAILKGLGFDRKQIIFEKYD